MVTVPNTNQNLKEIQTKPLKTLMAHIELWYDLVKDQKDELFHIRRCLENLDDPTAICLNEQTVLLKKSLIIRKHTALNNLTDSKVRLRVIMNSYENRIEEASKTELTQYHKFMNKYIHEIHSLSRPIGNLAFLQQKTPRKPGEKRPDTPPPIPPHRDLDFNPIYTSSRYSGSPPIKTPQTSPLRSSSTNHKQHTTPKSQERGLWDWTIDEKMNTQSQSPEWFTNHQGARAKSPTNKGTPLKTMQDNLIYFSPLQRTPNKIEQTNVWTPLKTTPTNKNTPPTEWTGDPVGAPEWAYKELSLNQFFYKYDLEEDNKNSARINANLHKSFETNGINYNTNFDIKLFSNKKPNEIGFRSWSSPKNAPSTQTIKNDLYLPLKCWHSMLSGMRIISNMKLQPAAQDQSSPVDVPLGEQEYLITTSTGTYCISISVLIQNGPIGTERMVHIRSTNDQSHIKQEVHIPWMCIPRFIHHGQQFGRELWSHTHGTYGEIPITFL